MARKTNNKWLADLRARREEREAKARRLQEYLEKEEKRRREERKLVYQDRWRRNRGLGVMGLVMIAAMVGRGD